MDWDSHQQIGSWHHIVGRVVFWGVLEGRQVECRGWGLVGVHIGVVLQACALHFNCIWI